MKKAINSFAKLTRFENFIYRVIITTLLGVTAAKGHFGWRLLALITANWLITGFAHIIGNIENAPDDALFPSKHDLNPLSSGLISPRAAHWFAVFTGVIAISLFGLMGMKPLIFGFLSLLLGYLYSKKSVQLKIIPVIDIISYSLMLAGLQFLTAYFTFTATFNKNGFWGLTFVMAATICDKLHTESHSYESKIPQKRTKPFQGNKLSSLFLMIMLLISIFSGAVIFVVIDLIPTWVIILMTSLACILILLVLVKNHQKDLNKSILGTLQRPLEQAAALALFLQYVIPWMAELLQVKIF